MLKEICDFCKGDGKGLGCFVGGILMGTVGVKLLTSDDAKKVYTQATAAALRGKEEAMTTMDTLRENCGDIYEDAKAINEKRAADKAAAQAVIENTAAAEA